MKATLQQIQSAILGHPVACSDPFFNRLCSVLPSAGRTSVVGASDLAALIRQVVLRAEGAREEQRELMVPVSADWPDASLWNRFSFDTLTTGAGFRRIRPRPWKPAWLDEKADDAVGAAIREERRRGFRAVSADPSVTQQVGFSTYASVGQRAAVQAAFLTPAGSTTIVCLPTGAGKSLAFQLPALAWQPEGGLTVVIVPTVALAKDQESRFKELWKRELPLAYHGVLDDDAKRAFRQAIRSGEIPIVFTSPEAALRSLKDEFLATAREGRLKLFAIDEAHLVAQWGEEFRPEFQSLTGLRDALLEACPPHARFRTLLMTATLTAETCETLRFLFGREQCEVVAEVALRPEIAFLMNAAGNEADRTQRVLEAVDHLPRPLIVYTTLRDHAEQWHQRLADRGYRRLRLVRGGDLTDEEGEQTLRDWRDGGVDVVVATSAFGVGMDQSNVRSIIHACLPETIDRYYQEAGRAGRDGSAAVALLATAPDDKNVADDLAEKRRISVERGFERWDSMWWSRTTLPDSTYLLPLYVSPADIPSPGQQSESWNLRTLVLMARAGLISFAVHPLPRIERLAGESQQAFDQRRDREYGKFRKQVAIRVLDEELHDEAHWARKVAEVRTLLRDQDRNASQWVGELRTLSRPLNELFRKVYRLTSPPLLAPRLAGSCPITRERNAVSFRSADPEIVSFSKVEATITKKLARDLLACTDSTGRSWFSYTPPVPNGLEARQWHKSLMTALRYFVAQGVVEFCLPGGTCEENDWSQLIAESASRFVIRGNLGDEHASELFARVTMLDRKQLSAAVLDSVKRLRRPRHIIMVPHETRDPARPDRLLLDRINHLSLEELLMRIAR